MYKVKAICLRATDYREKDKILTLASLEKGKISVVCRGVKSANAKLKSVAMPLCFGDYIINDGKIGVVVGADIEDNFFECWGDMIKCASAFGILEILEKTNVNGEDISSDIILALRALKVINYGTINPKGVLLWFGIKTLAEQGIDFVDISAIPKDIKSVYSQMNELSIEDLESYEITENALNDSLRCQFMIFCDSLNIKLNILKNGNIYQ